MNFCDFCIAQAWLPDTSNNQDHGEVMPLDTSPDALKNGVRNKPAPQAIDVHVGARLSRRRKELGFCQERLGREMELNEATIRSFESGYTRVGSQNLLKLSQVLNTTIGFFYSD